MKWARPCTVFLLIPGLFSFVACRRTAQDFQKTLQERLIAAKPGDVIDLPEGKFHFSRTLSLTVNGVTLRGKGQDKTILSFAGQTSGAQGVLVKADDFLIQDLGIEDTAGDALTIQGGRNIIVRRVRTEWTRGPNEANGPYGIYPVECKNLLVEDSISRGAADAGIYVGQSENVVLRRNRVESNVDGFEIENTENVDAYENVATHNTGGMGVFNLPNLPRQGGRHVRVFNNQLVENNTPNFAPKSLGPIHYLPTGTGMYILAIRDVEAFNNKIQNNTPSTFTSFITRPRSMSNPLRTPPLLPSRSKSSPLTTSATTPSFKTSISTTMTSPAAASHPTSASRVSKCSPTLSAANFPMFFMMALSIRSGDAKGPIPVRSACKITAPPRFSTSTCRAK